MASVFVVLLPDYSLCTIASYIYSESDSELGGSCIGLDVHRLVEVGNCSYTKQ